MERVPEISDALLPCDVSVGRGKPGVAGTAGSWASGLQQIPFLCLQRKQGTSDTSFLTSGLRHCVSTSFSYSQPPRVWLLVVTAVGAAHSACRVPRGLGGLHQLCGQPPQQS